ncbi:Protein kinase of the Mitotic Exit Network [Kalmusia sp. IMI 367209]|nr:Protein kinase of the Mitotic Exit Network [Kalmusia sp. IMI 367209]
MVSHPPKAAHAHSSSRSSQHNSNGSNGHAKKTSSSSNGRAPSREGRPSREGTAQRAAQDVAGLRDFQLGDCLGRGAFGSVYRALNWGTGETVAVKQVKLETLGQADLKTIMLEIDLLKSLTHPNIVKYKGSVKSAESLYIILEFCENGSLHSVCKNFGKFPEPLVGFFMSQVLQGLLYLHEQGVIHRDIKGANILTTKEGLVKLADFGVATKQSGLDQASVVGTPYWMAPEVIELSGATTAADIWSVGCTIIELIDGKPPYHKLQPMQALFRIVNDDHPPIPGSVSKLLRDFLMECFQKNPNLRIDARRLLKHPWISSTKRTAPAVASTGPEFNEAVNRSVQQYNEALTSEPSLHRSSTAAPPPRRVPVNVNLNIPKQRPTAESFRSPEIDKDDNWDDDFAESISPRAFHQPHLKPQDNFGGLFSSDKLKAIASFDAVMEEPFNFDGEATVKSPLNLQHLRGLPSVFAQSETTKPSSTRVRASTSRSTSTSTVTDEQHEGQPKTAFLRGVPKASQSSKKQATALARPSQMFRETSVEDYSDLTPTDESAFELKLKAMQIANPPSMFPRDAIKRQSTSPAETFSPKLFHPNDLKSAPRSTRDANTNGARQRSVSSTSTRKMQRTQSEIEMQKYAEDDRDDFSDVFGDIKPSRAESDSGSEHSSLAMITSKMSSSFMLADDDDLDPFANMDEGLENINLENNVARDRDDRLTKQTESLVASIKINQPDDILLDIADQLLEVLYESPEKRSIVLRSHGMLPILEIMEQIPPNEVVLPLLKIINLIIHEDAESQESLSMLGGIPTICTFASKKYPSDIRKEAAAFVRQMYQTSTLTLQIFVGCGGINVLVDFLEEDIDDERDLVLIGVNGVWNMFELQGSAPKNDFCRLLSRSAVLYPLSLVLNRVINEKDEVAQLIQGRIVNIFLIFSQAESFVKELVADRMILKRVLKDLPKMIPVHQVTMLKFIKNLSMLSSTHEALQNSNAIDTLIELLKNTRTQSNSREISNQVLNTMYNLCRHNKSRQEEAALSDIIPLLKDVVNGGGPLKEFALPILCELAHSGKVARKMLWDAKGLQFYISMLSDRNWQVTALDAIFVWLQEETARVEQYLLSSNFSTAIISSYTSPELSQSNFENMLEPLQKLVRLSPPIAASLAVPEIFTRTVQKLGHKDAVTRLNLLRILSTICDATEDECTLIRQFGVYDTIVHLSEHDHAVLVRQMASELVRACDSVSKRSTSRASGFRRPASSSGTRAGSGSSNGGSTLVSGMTPPTPNSLKTAFAIPPMPPMPPTPTLMGSSRERVARSQSTVGIWDLQEEPERVKMPSLARASTALGVPNSSSSSSLSSRSRPPSRDTSSSSLVQRLDTGAKELTGTGGKSRLPKARQGRLSEAVSRRRQSQAGQGEENVTPGGSGSSTPLPRLQIVRRRRETSGGEMSSLGRRGAAD